LEYLSFLNENESDKVLAKRKKVEKAILRREKEETKVVERTKRAEKKAKKAQDKNAEKTSKVARKSLNTLEAISGASPSSQSRKPDEILVGLSFFTLQYGTSPLTRVSTCASVVGDEFFMPGSLLTLDAHFSKHLDFPNEWNDLQAFLERVSSM
jgi:neutral trehalase